MTSASAGKMGFCSSGSTRPTSRARCPRSLLGRSYPSTSSAVSTASLVLSDTPALPLSTRLTVASLTPTFLATSASRRAGVRVMLQTIRHFSASYSRLPPVSSLSATVIKLCLFIRSSTSCNQMSGNVSCSQRRRRQTDSSQRRGRTSQTSAPGKGWSDEEQTALRTALPPGSRGRRRSRNCSRRRSLRQQQQRRRQQHSRLDRPGDYQHRLRAARGAAAGAEQGVAGGRGHLRGG